MRRGPFWEVLLLVMFCLVAAGCGKKTTGPGRPATGGYDVRSASIEYCDG